MAIDLTAAAAVTPQDVSVTGPAEQSSIVANAKVIVPEEVPEKTEFRTRAGVSLVKWVLIIISAFVFITIVWIWTSEFAFAERVDNLIKLGNGLTKEAADQFLSERTNFREFWLKIFQMVLLNVLLPVLTALLGYIFGSSREQKEGGSAT